MKQEEDMVSEIWEELEKKVEVDLVKTHFIRS